MTLIAIRTQLCTGNSLDGPGWDFDPWVVAPLVVSAVLYCCGAAALWHRVGLGRGIRRRQAAAYASGWLILAVALVSPLHWVFETLFTFHMIEHELIMAISAPLIALACPVAAALWAFPRQVRAWLNDAASPSAARRGWSWLIRPRNATILHGVAIWAWHAPPAFDAAVLDPSLHRLQHLSFLVTAIMFWWSLFRRSNPGAASGHLFVTMMHTGILGALIALAPRVLYPAQTAFAPYWGLSPLEDQQLAGLLMWVPAGTIYAGVALYFLSRWIRHSHAAWSRDDVLQRP